MGDIDADSKVSGPAERPRVMVRYLVRYKCRIALWVELGFGSHVSGRVRLSSRFPVNHV